MRAVIISLVAAAALATPAMANEARVEARGGIVWGGGSTDEIAGVAAGYDWDLGDSAFIGLEASGDKVLVSNTRVSLGLGARVGVKTSEAGKLYGIASYQTKFAKFGDDSVAAGVGYQHGFGGNFYGKVEYRHFFFDGTDANVAGIGLGYKF